MYIIKLSVKNHSLAYYFGAGYEARRNLDTIKKHPYKRKSAAEKKLKELKERFINKDYIIEIIDLSQEG